MGDSPCLGLFLFSKIFGVDMNNCVVFLLAYDKLIFSTLYLPKNAELKFF